MLLSVAMMLRHSLDRPDEADALESSIHQCWDEGILTPDLVPGGCGTARVTEAVCERLSSSKNTAAEESGKR
jgi:3-isopropylmalate dehydrogenase